VFGTSHPELIPGSARRWISYGLLGPHAISVSYTADGQKRTIPVEPGSGAYLVVLTSLPKGSFETGGGATSFDQFIGPQGAISTITYRMHGKPCSESRPSSEAQSAHPQCPRPQPTRLRGGQRRLHRPVSVRVAASGSATVTFTAPRAVTSALSGYAIEVPSPCHNGTSGLPVERDLRAGEVVHVTLPGLFANACGRTVTVRVSYQPNRERFPLGEHDVIVGETVVKR
jgi:hypothetical protein